MSGFDFGLLDALSIYLVYISCIQWKNNKRACVQNACVQMVAIEQIYLMILIGMMTVEYDFENKRERKSSFQYLPTKIYFVFIFCCSTFIIGNDFISISIRSCINIVNGLENIRFLPKQNRTFWVNCCDLFCFFFFFSNRNL